jgi:hypothetical protein
MSARKWLGVALAVAMVAVLFTLCVTAVGLWGAVGAFAFITAWVALGTLAAWLLVEP